MGYSLLNDQIHIYMDNADNRFSVLLDEESYMNPALRSCRSARQNPDLSRLEIASLIRRTLKIEKSRKANPMSWSAFAESHVSNNANCNNKELS